METGVDSKVVHDLIRSLPFFDSFTDGERKKIADLKTDVLRFDPEEVIIQEKNFDEKLFVLLRGVVRVVKFKPKELLITKLSSGAMFGEISWLGKRDRITSVIAGKNVIALRLDFRNSKKFDLEMKEKIKDKLIEALIHRLEYMNERLIKLTHNK